MSNKIIEKRYTFIEAANGAGLTPKQLRHWLDKERGYGLILDAEIERPGDGWRRFSLVDVLRIAFIGSLVESCILVKEAAPVVEDLIKRRMGLLMRYENTPSNAILASFKQTFWMVWRNQDGKIETDIAPRVEMLRAGLFPSKFIVISPHDIAWAVFERLDLQVGHPDGFSDGNEYLSREDFEAFEQAHNDSIQELIGIITTMKETRCSGPEQVNRFRDVWNTLDEQMRLMRFLRPLEPSSEDE